MAYTHTYPHSLGLDLGELITKGGPAIQAVSKIVEDPALPEVTCHVLRLNKVTEGQNPGLPCTRKVYTLAEKRKGVGLARVVTPLRAAVWARQNPLLAGAIGVASVGALVGLGYYLGKGRRA